MWPGAYYEGKYVGTKLAECVKSSGVTCKDEVFYDIQDGSTTSSKRLGLKKGWGKLDL